MAYRSSPLERAGRCAKIEARLAELRPRVEALREVEQESRELERVLDEERRATDRWLALPMLDDVRIASPCEQSWDAMRGDARVRFCGRCRKNVYNLSAMSREEAEALVRDQEGVQCVRYYRRGDGTILTTDCPPGRRTVRRRRGILAAAISGLLCALGLRSPSLPPPRPPALTTNPGMWEPRMKTAVLVGMGALGGSLPSRSSRFTGFEILDQPGSSFRR